MPSRGVLCSFRWREIISLHLCGSWAGHLEIWFDSRLLVREAGRKLKIAQCKELDFLELFTEMYAHRAKHRAELRSSGRLFDIVERLDGTEEKERKLR